MENINDPKEKNLVRSHEYVIGDIHGCFSEFKQLTQRIIEKDSEAQFILVGDIVDRGSQSIEALNWAMRNVNVQGSRYKMIVGNHEYDKISLLDEYLRYGSTVDRYGFFQLIEQYGMTKGRVIDIRNFFADLPVYYETNASLKLNNGKTRKQHYIIVHGGISYSCINKDGTFSRQFLSNASKDSMLRATGRDAVSSIVWERNYFGNSDTHGTIIVHGHTPTLERDLIVRGATSGRIDFKLNDINVDCGLVFRQDWKDGNLAAVCLDDLEEYYLYEPKERNKQPVYKDRMLSPRKRNKSGSTDNSFPDDVDFFS